MGEKITVSYVSLVAYILFVIVGSLLVGLLPAFVDRPKCANNDAAVVKSAVYSQLVEINQPKQLPELKKIRSRRNIPTDPQGIQKRLEKKEKLEKSLPEHLNRIRQMNPRFEEYTIRNQLDLCQDVYNPNSSVQYPWYNYRLPTNIHPLNYDLFLFLPLWGAESIYDGVVDIRINVTSPTDTIILNIVSTDEIPKFRNLTDSNGNEVAVKCAGEFDYYEYLIYQTKNPLSVGIYTLSLSFLADLNKVENGLFEFNFASGPNPSYKNSTMLASKFEPIDARRAFPCFDEPQFKATFNVTIVHPPNTTALFNTPRNSDSVVPNTNFSLITTNFEVTPKMQTSLLGLVIFYDADFKFVSGNTNTGIPVKLWARNHFIDAGQADMALEMAINIYNSLTDIFSGTPSSARPPKIDIFAIPDYPTDAIPHFGLAIFAENKILMGNSSASERNKQDVALLIAKQFVEFWFGNFVSFKWWNELWLQEAIGDFMKYFAVDQAYPEYRIKQQFITEELVEVLIDDAYPSSHPINKTLDDPYEIEQYFDKIARSKAAAILRMFESDVGETSFLNSLKTYLKANEWGTGDLNQFLSTLDKIGNWTAKDFFERWIDQPNYPVVFVSLVRNGNNNYSINVKQDRNINSEFSIFSGDLLYPSKWSYEWYIPLKCDFGFLDNDGYSEVHEEIFYVNKKNSTLQISGNRDYKWVHCDRNFEGYYVVSYTSFNWDLLADELIKNKQNFDPEDRASLIHHSFQESYSQRSDYSRTVKLLSYLKNETDYLPWRTVYHHVNFLMKVLDYDKAFLQVSNFFINEIAKLETDQLWQPTDVHIQELLSETILELSCRIQDSYCIEKTAFYWTSAKASLLNPALNNTIPPYVRSIVYNYHFQNTYDVDDWLFLFLRYDLQSDLVEQERYLKALTYTRLPWLLAKLVESINERINSLDIFDLFKYMCAQPLGREITWDYFRNNYYDLLKEYGQDDPRLGDLLINIASSFENEYMFYELLEFVFFTSVGATSNARFKALEVTSTNIIWLLDNEYELLNSFGSGAIAKTIQDSSSIRIKLKEMYEQFKSGKKMKTNKKFEL